MSVEQHIKVDGKRATVEAWSVSSEKPTKGEIAFMMSSIAYCKRTRPDKECRVDQGKNTLKLDATKQICRPMGDCAWDFVLQQSLSLERRVSAKTSVDGDYTTKIMSGIIK